MGFDWGKRYIGISLGDTLTKQARDLYSITNQELGKTNWQEILNIINEWKPNILVVGVPYNKEHKNQILEKLALKFANELAKKTNIKTEIVDEHLTTWQAKYEMGKFNNFNKKELMALNTKAAKIILDEWLNNQNSYD